MMYAARKWDTISYSRFTWWSRHSLTQLFLKGMLATVIFLLIVGSFLWLFGCYKYSSTNSLSFILDKMEYHTPADMEESKIIDFASQWFASDGSAKDSSYLSYEKNNDNIIELRKSFINSYIADPEADLQSKNPYGILTDLVTEKKIENMLPKSCNTASDTFLLMWLKIFNKNFDYDEYDEFSTKDCSDNLKSASSKIEGICDWSMAIPDISKHTRSTVVPGLDDFFIAAFTGDMATGSSKSIITSMPYNQSCNTVYKNGTRRMDRQLLLAQLDLLFEQVKPVYRMAAIVYGPIQLLLLTIFFSGCIALGVRRQLSCYKQDGCDSQDEPVNPEESSEKNEDDTPKKSNITTLHINDLIEERIDHVKENSKADITVVKNILLRELDEEASFPITFAAYVLGMVGFIGTVIGIAASLASSADVVQAATQGISAQKEAIDQVTGMLGIAFDTTLIALGTSALIYYLHSYIRTTEHGLIRNYKESDES